MERRELPAGALEVMLKEHASLRDEIKERLKTAFTHFAYAGAIAAFALPAADKVSECNGTTLRPARAITETPR